MDGELSVDQLRERLKGLKELVDEGLFTQEDYDRMKGAYVAAEVISVGRRTGIVSSGTEEQAIKRAFWESVTSARSAGGRETASYDFYQIRSPSSQPETPHGTRAAPTPHNTRAAPTPVPTPSQGPSRAQSRAHSGHSTPVPRALSHGRASQDRPPGLSTLPPLVDNEGGPVAAQQAKDPRQLPGAVALPGMAALQNGRPPHALRPVSSAQSDSTGNDDPAPPTSIDGHQYATPSAPSAPAAPNTQPIASTTDDHPSVSVPTMSVPVPSRQGSAAGTVDRAPPRGTVVNEGNNLAGIGFDQAIAAEYKQLLQRGAYMWMIFKIEDGKAVVMETTGDPGTSWSDLMDHLPQHEPRFVLYDHHFRLGDGCQFNKLVFVVWAPESAPVRLKMLYSAGKDALRRNLPGVTVEMQACDWEDMSLAEVDARVRAITQGG